MFCNEITPLSPASLTLSSLGSASACNKQKQPSEDPTNGSGGGVYCSKTQTQPVTMDETHNAMMSYIEREWALAAARNGGENTYDAYMASIGQLAGQQPFSLSQPIASKHVALPNIAPLQQNLQQHVQQQQVQDEEEVDEDEQEEVKPLTKAQRNKEEAKDLITMINSVQIDDDEDEIYDSCPEVAQKINHFLQLPGVNKAIFLKYAMDQEGRYVMLKDFIEGNNQKQCKTKIYGKA